MWAEARIVDALAAVVRGDALSRSRRSARHGSSTVSERAGRARTRCARPARRRRPLTGSPTKGQRPSFASSRLARARDVFRRGVQRYLRRERVEERCSDDLFEALEYVLRRSSWRARPRLPRPTRCARRAGELDLRAAGRSSQPVRAASARKWKRIAPKLDPARGVETRRARRQSCFTLGPDPIVRDLDRLSRPGCIPIPVKRATIDSSSTARTAHGARARLAGARGDPPPGLVSNAWAEVRQGAVGGSVLLEMLPLFDSETERNVVEQIASTLQGIDQALVDDDVRDAFRRWVVARMAVRRASLGWEPAPNENDDRTIERRTVLWLSGELGYDEATLAEAQQYAESWLTTMERPCPGTEKSCCARTITELRSSAAIHAKRVMSQESEGICHAIRIDCASRLSLNSGKPQADQTDFPCS